MHDVEIESRGPAVLPSAAKNDAGGLGLAMTFKYRFQPWNGSILAMAPSNLANGHTHHQPTSIPHTMEKNLPGGGNWVVQKFGGTSVGKFALNITDIVQTGLQDRRIAIVCSARSNHTKAEGTTNRILRALREPDAAQCQTLVEAIRLDHLSAAQKTIRSPAILKQLEKDLSHECAEVMEDLKATRRVGVGLYAENKLVGTGERLSCLYMTALLEDNGTPAHFVNLSEIIPWDFTGDLDEHFYINLGQKFAEKVKACGEKVPVITGYFGNVPGGLLKAIGRGYTDLCAALVAVGLQASELQIWKEVDGIFTADPRKVPTARLLDSASPSEAAELTFYGSEVIHPFTMEQVIRARIPIRIKNVMNARNKGTVIFPDPKEEITQQNPLHDARLFRTRSTSNVLNAIHQSPKRPTAVTVKRNMVVINVHSTKRIRAHGFLMNVFAILDKWHLSVDIISSSEVQLSLALHSEAALLSGSTDEEIKIQDQDLEGAIRDLSKIGTIDLVPHMAIVTLIGKQLNNMVGIAGKFFSVLGDNNINIQMISQGASEITIGCVIQERDADRALNVLHTNLFTFLD